MPPAPCGCREREAFSRRFKTITNTPKVFHPVDQVDQKPVSIIRSARLCQGEHPRLHALLGGGLGRPQHDLLRLCQQQMSEKVSIRVRHHGDHLPRFTTSHQAENHLVKSTRRVCTPLPWEWEGERRGCDADGVWLFDRNPLKNKLSWRTGLESSSTVVNWGFAPFCMPFPLPSNRPASVRGTHLCRSTAWVEAA